MHVSCVRYRCRGAVDNHNALRYNGVTKSQISLESTWGTTWWFIRVFAFSVACTEVNAYLALKYFLKTDEVCMKFWAEMAKTLIYQ